MGIKEAFANMSEDVKAKLKNIKTKEDLEALLKEENIEITPEELDALAGGGQGRPGCQFFTSPCYGDGCGMVVTGG